MTRAVVAEAKQAAPARRVSQPHDRDEREAERVADEVARGASVAGWSFASLPPSPPSIHRCAGPGKCDCPRCRAQAQQLEGGAALDTASRRFMETAFGRDFGSVRLHGDSRAAASARSLDATAYAVGEDIVTAGETPTAATESGRRLLAHELTHVVQHRASGDTATVHRQAASAAPAPAPGPAPAAPAAPPPARPEREERFNLGRGGSRVDAELYRPTGWLTVKMKVLFNFVNTLQPWPSVAKQNEWRDAFIRTVHNRWSFKHFLVPQRACPGEPQQVVVNMVVVPVTSNPHMTMNIRYTDQEPTSSVTGHTAEMDVKDVEQRGDVPQTPAEHEFGHMLGLPHIHCESSTDQSCYGVTREEKADVMGMGSYVSPRDYEPFAELMPYFTSCNYRVRQASYIPTSRGPDIGGAIGGILGGIAGLAGGAALGAMLGPIGAIVGGALGLVAGGLVGYFAGRALGTPEIPS